MKWIYFVLATTFTFLPTANSFALDTYLREGEAIEEPIDKDKDT